jgi:hypothetical protein
MTHKSSKIVPLGAPSLIFRLLKDQVEGFSVGGIKVYRVRFNGWVYRAKEPGWFLWDVALDYLIGVFFVGYFLYKVYGPPN